MTIARSPFRIQTRSSLICAAAVCAFSLAAPAPAAAKPCMPLEFLFGACRMTASSAAQPALSIRATPARMQRREARHAVVAPRAQKPARPIPHGNHPVARDNNNVIGKQRALAFAPETPAGSLAMFAQDTTLRPGDIVVTPEGFRVYSGRNMTRFEPLRRADATLTSLEKASVRASGAGWTAAMPLSPDTAHD